MNIRGVKMMKQSLIKNIVILSCLCIGLCGCGNRQEENTAIQVEGSGEESTNFSLSQVKKGTVTSEVLLSCQYSPREKIPCSFTGERKIIKEILVEKGDLVTKGQIIAKLDVEDLDEKIKEEQHEIEMAQLESDHLQALKKVDLDILLQEYNYVEKEKRDSETYNQNKKGITKEYDNAITDCGDRITVHQMRLAEYQKEMEEGIMRAPDDGVVIISKLDQVGSYSKPEESIITVIRNDDLTFISDDIDKAQYLKDGETYQVLVGKGEAQQSIDVTPIDREAWENQIFFEIQVPNLKLETGAKGELWIQLSEKDNVLYVPNTAIHQSGDKYYVYTVTEEGLRNIQYVTVGITGRENTEIKDGLTLDQSVITD